MTSTCYLDNALHLIIVINLFVLVLVSKIMSGSLKYLGFGQGKRDQNLTKVEIR
jgi:hypothetical protein